MKTSKAKEKGPTSLQPFSQDDSYLNMLRQ